MAPPIKPDPTLDNSRQQQRKADADAAKYRKEAVAVPTRPSPPPKEEPKPYSETRESMKVGLARGGIAKQNTNHGKMDMPFHSLRSRAGMARGGFMRKGKRFDEGGVTEGQNANIDDDTRARAMRWVQQQQEGGSAAQPAATPRATPRPVRKAASATPVKQSNDDARDVMSRAPAKSSNDDTRDVMSRAPAKSSSDDVSKPYFGMRRKASVSDSLTPEQRSENADRLADAGLTAASFTPVGRGVVTAGNAAKAAVTAANARRAENFNRARNAINKPGEKLRETYRNSERTRAPHELDGYKKGGNVKTESKAMVKKEVDFFKKKGAPKAMVKHEQAEMKEARFARGGGIESRGKTKGTVIKMARGGGIEVRGKTKGKMC